MKNYKKTSLNEVFLNCYRASKSFKESIPHHHRRSSGYSWDGKWPSTGTPSDGEFILVPTSHYAFSCLSDYFQEVSYRRISEDDSEFPMTKSELKGYIRYLDRCPYLKIEWNGSEADYELFDSEDNKIDISDII